MARAKYDQWHKLRCQKHSNVPKPVRTCIERSPGHFRTKLPRKKDVAILNYLVFFFKSQKTIQTVELLIRKTVNFKNVFTKQIEGLDLDLGKRSQGSE